jgi:hypothetical protein
MDGRAKHPEARRQTRSAMDPVFDDGSSDVVHLCQLPGSVETIDSTAGNNMDHVYFCTEHGG